eukprot:6186159-Pleurochrysis_carterae.AAC.1
MDHHAARAQRKLTISAKTCGGGPESSRAHVGPVITNGIQVGSAGEREEKQASRKERGALKCGHARPEPRACVFARRLSQDPQAADDACTAEAQDGVRTA